MRIFNIFQARIFEILIIHKPSLWSRDVSQKSGHDRFSRFDVYWIQTNKHQDRQAKFIHRLYNITPPKKDKFEVYAQNILKKSVYNSTCVSYISEICDLL